MEHAIATSARKGQGLAALRSSRRREGQGWLGPLTNALQQSLYCPLFNSIRTNYDALLAAAAPAAVPTKPRRRALLQRTGDRIAWGSAPGALRASCRPASAAGAACSRFPAQPRSACTPALRQSGRGSRTSREPLQQGRSTVKIHHSITPERVTEAVERAGMSLDNPGFCTACGAEAEGVEPDARRYECESCGERAVFGAEELLMMLA